MKCELCNKTIRPGEIAHGIRYGTADGETDVFLPARDSAWSVTCSFCGDMVLKLIYAKLKSKTSISINPALYKTFTQTR
ncbi:hypothetical protein AOG1_12810 [Geobacter sp. AOG1]|nr:hypothetical protein AOG1_12810 [Geobacter sp. AOG1]